LPAASRGSTALPATAQPAPATASSSVITVAKRYTLGVAADSGSKGGLRSVVPISSPGPIAAPDPIPRKPGWKLTSAIALIVMAVTGSVVSLTNESSYLARTQLGTLLRRAIIGRHAAPQLALSQRRLTANPNDAPLGGGIISPDGKYLAYSDPTGLYLRQVDGGETLAVPLPKGFVAVPESWFPDSVHLAVRQLDASDKKPPSLWQISVMGGTPRILAEEGFGAMVSPDGSKISFLASQAGHIGVWLIDPDTNTRREIIDGGGDLLTPTAWAPDGKRFAFVRVSEHSGRQIQVFDLANGRSETVLSDAALGGQLVWVTATRLVYSLTEPAPNQDDFNLWRLSLDSSTGQASGAPTRLTSDRGCTVNISATSDGRRMALLRRASQADVYLTDVEEQGKRLSKPRRFTLDDRQDFPFAWTADSTTVLFLSDRDGLLHIYKQRIDQTQPELLVGGKESMWVPGLTPDGLSVLYLVNPKQGDQPVNSRIMRVHLTGGLSQSVLEAPDIHSHRCARLPSTVCVFSQIDAGQQRFFTFDPESGSRMELADAKMKMDDGPGHNWDLSPDGKYLVMLKWIGPSKEFGLRIFDLATGGERSIPAKGPTEGVGTNWAADSKSVWIGGFIRNGPWGYSGVSNVDLNGRVRTLLEEPNLSIWAAIPSPDGRHLALVGHTEDSNAWLLENF